MKRLLFALIAASLPLVAASPAAAHTSVRETSITNNATLSAAPQNFTVTFSAATGLANDTINPSPRLFTSSPPASSIDLRSRSK